MHNRTRMGVALGCSLGLASCGGGTATPPSALSSLIDSLSAESMRDGKVPGLAITIVRGDSVVHSKGYGSANLEQQVPMTDTTPVVIGSTSKTFTSFAIMQLADSGRIVLDSSVTRYIAMLGAPSRSAGETESGLRPLSPVDPRFRRITVRHLLTNVGGLPAGFSGDAYEVVDTAQDALERLVRDDMLRRKLDFDPGTGYTYSNRGFSLASLAVQDVAGMSYEDYVAARIFTPLGMTHSTGRFWEGAGRGVVQGYRESVDGKPLARAASLGREWTGAGMILSTSRDVGRYLQVLLHGGQAPNGSQILSAAATAELLRPQQKAESELGGDTMYGLGWEISDMNGLTVAMKGGSVGSMGSLFLLIPEQRVGIAMVFNAIDYGKVQLLQNIVKALMGTPAAPYQVAPAPAAVPAGGFAMSSARLREFVGTYDTRAGLMKVHVKGDSLTSRYEGNDVVLEPASDTSFVMRSVLREQEGASLVFKRCGLAMCVWMRGDSSGVRR